MARFCTPQVRACSNNAIWCNLICRSELELENIVKSWSMDIMGEKNREALLTRTIILDMMMTDLIVDHGQTCLTNTHSACTKHPIKLYMETHGNTWTFMEKCEFYIICTMNSTSNARSFMQKIFNISSSFSIATSWQVVQQMKMKHRNYQEYGIV